MANKEKKNALVETGAQKVTIPENVRNNAGIKADFESKLFQKRVTFVNPQSDPERYSLDDYGLGILFSDVFSGVLRFVPEEKCWYYYKDGKWRKDNLGLVAEQCASELLEYLKSLNLEDVESQKLIELLSSYSKRQTMLKEAKRANPISLGEFDNKPHLLNCLNCTLDLTDKIPKRIEHSPEHLLTRQINADYVPNIDCKLWLKFTGEVMDGDPELCRYFQRAFGYTTVGDTSKECFFILYGSKTRNGKGTTCETIRHLMGDYGETFSAGCLSMRNPNSNYPSPELADLAGVRFVNVSEPQKGQKLNVALIKQLTGGDMVKARHLRKNTFEYRPQFKLFINTNHLLEIDDDTLFSSSRLKMIPFLRHFDENTRDESLKTTFREPKNMSGILNWLLEGYKFFREEDLEPPEKAIKALEDYRRESDTIALFIEQELDKTGDSKTWIKTGDLYKLYKLWCVKVDVDEKSQKDFVTALRNKNLVSRHNTEGHIVRGYTEKKIENADSN
jgi:putative DNA primase/helicase